MKTVTLLVAIALLSACTLQSTEVSTEQQGVQIPVAPVAPTIPEAPVVPVVPRAPLAST